MAERTKGQISYVIGKTKLCHVETDASNPHGAGRPICSIPAKREADADFICAAWNACDAAGIVNPEKLPEAIDVLKRLAAFKSGPTPSDRAEWIGKMLDMADEARSTLAALKEQR